MNDELRWTVWGEWKSIGGNQGEWKAGLWCWGICFVAAETQQCSTWTSRQPQNFFSCHGKDVKGCKAEQGDNRAGQGGAGQGSYGFLGQCTTKTNTHNQSKFMTSSPEIQLKHLIGTPISCPPSSCCCCSCCYSCCCCCCCVSPGWGPRLISNGICSICPYAAGSFFVPC